MKFYLLTHNEDLNEHLLFHNSLVNAEFKNQQIDSDQKEYVTKFTQKEFGIFQINSFTTILDKKKDTLKSGWLCADKSSNIPLLYVSDLGNNLKYSGKVTITGNISLPNENFIKQSITHDFTSPSSLKREGKISLSKKTLPKLLTEFNEPKSSYTVEFSKLASNEIDVDFQSETLIIDFDNNTLKDIELVGNIFIKSNNHIEIASSANIENIIVKAPSIRIQPGFKGSLQAIAKDSIIIRENVELKTGSVLWISGNSDDSPCVKISENCNIDAISVLKQKSSRKPYFKFHVASQYSGVIYNEGITEFRGKLDGNLLSNELGLITGDSQNLNILKDVTIENSKKQLIGVNLCCGNNEKDIIRKIR